MDAASTPATDAQARADGSLARPKVTKFAADPILAAHVSERLEAKDSPMTISIELARGTHGLVGSVSHECIYQAVDAHGTRVCRQDCTRGCTVDAGAVDTVSSVRRHQPRARSGYST